MTQRTRIAIYSHWDHRGGIFKSNYEKENFWPANQKTVWITSQFLGKLQIIFGQNTSDYRLAVQDYTESSQGYLLIFYGSSAPILEHHGLAFVTREQVQKCNQGSLKLLIVFVHETFDSKISTREWFGNFCNKLSVLGLVRPSSVVILTGTKFTADTSFDHRCEFVYYPWFEADLQASLKLTNKSPNVIDFERKQKHYINLNLAIRPHRFLMVMYLMYRHVHEHGHISWRNPQAHSWREILNSHGFDHCDFSWIKQLDRFGHGNTSFLNFVTNMGVLNSLELDQVNFNDTGAHNGMTWHGAQEFYCDSWIDLVNETHCELYGDVFLTEKTFKPLAYGLPFVLNASRNSLDLVRQLGYESFPELFNENYDSMPASMNKIAAIGEEVVAFCTQPDRLNRMKTDPGIRTKLQHNQDLFWKKNHAQQLGQLLHQAWARGHA